MKRQRLGSAATAAIDIPSDSSDDSSNSNDSSQEPIKVVHKTMKPKALLISKTAINALSSHSKATVPGRRNPNKAAKQAPSSSSLEYAALVSCTKRETSTSSVVKAAKEKDKDTVYNDNTDNDDEDEDIIQEIGKTTCWT